MINAATQAAPPSLVTQAETFVDDTWNIISWPEEDLAAVLGWDVGWTIMLFGMLKVVSVALSHERKARGKFF